MAAGGATNSIKKGQSSCNFLHGGMSNEVKIKGQISVPCIDGNTGPAYQYGINPFGPQSSGYKGRKVSDADVFPGDLHNGFPALLGLVRFR